MSLQSKDEISISNPNQIGNPYFKPPLTPEPCSVHQKEKEKKSISNNSTFKETNATSVLNSKDLEIFNNLANKIVNSSKPNIKKTNKTSKIIAYGDKNNGSLLDIKKIETEIYNKINNFSLKYSTERYGQKANQDLSSDGSARKSKHNSNHLGVRKDIKSVNGTPKKSISKLTNSKSYSDLKKNNKDYIIKNNYVANSNNRSINLNNEKLFNNNSQLSSFNERINSSLVNSSFLNKRIKSNLNASGVSPELKRDHSGFSVKSQLSRDYSSVNRAHKISPIYPENYENCEVSSCEEKVNLAHKTSFVKNKNDLVLDRSIVLKPVYLLSKQTSERVEFEVDMKVGNLNADEINNGNQVDYLADGEGRNEFESKANHSVEFDKSKINNKIQNSSIDKELNKNSSELRRTHQLRNSMEQSYDRSSFNKMPLSKSQNFTRRKNNHSSLDISELSYDLVKEYSHLRIEKEEEFMKRMLFDIFKRQTKNERMERIIEKSKPRIQEEVKIKAFNRLIEDANRRLQAQVKLYDLKEKLIQDSKEKRNISEKDWKEIYKNRFLIYQDYKENWIKEKQTEKEEFEKKLEEEISRSRKSIKKPKKNVEEFCNRMYYEAKRRQLRDIRNREIYENQKLKEELEIKYAWKQSLKNSLNFSIEVKNGEPKHFKSRSKSRENNKSPLSKLKSKNELNLSKSASANFLGNSKNKRINNARFDRGLNENSTSLHRNLSKVSSLSRDDKAKEFGAYEKFEIKTPNKNKVEDYSSNLLSANIKNMIDIKNNLFEISDEDVIKEVPKPYIYRVKKPCYKIVPIAFSNTKMNYLPDHVAFGVVDNILNPKLYN